MRVMGSEAKSCIGFQAEGLPVEEVQSITTTHLYIHGHFKACAHDLFALKMQLISVLTQRNMLSLVRGAVGLPTTH